MKHESDLWPNFFLVGAAKSGTTSLYYYLKQHPQIFMSAIKEPHYFSSVQSGTEFSQPITDKRSYLQLFATASDYSIRGEASPSYLWFDEAAKRLQASVPKARIAVILRDPIERAYSHYLMDVRANRQHLPFYKALKDDCEQALKSWHVSNLYVELGLYSRQLQKYFQVFDPAQIKIVFFSDLKQNPRYVVQELLTFLEVDLQPLAQLQVDVSHNPYLLERDAVKLLQQSNKLRQLYQDFIPLTWRMAVRNRWLMKSGAKPAIDSAAKAFLYEIYAPEMDALENLLERPLPQMRQSW